MAIHIFVKGLQGTHTTTAKTYEKDPQMLPEVIRLVENLNAAQHLTAMLTPSMVSMMSNDDGYFVCGQTGHYGCHFPNVQCYSCVEFGHGTGLPQQDSCLMNTTPPRQILFKASICPHPKGQITLHPLWSQTWATFHLITILPPFPL